MRAIYTDEAGNKVYKRFIKTRGVWQFSVKNRAGRLVNTEGTLKLMRKAGIKLRSTK